MDNKYNLQRFVDAQQPVISSVMAELKHGRKHGHWIWFIFPQLKGLGHSANSDFTELFLCKKPPLTWHTLSWVRD